MKAIPHYRVDRPLLLFMLAYEDDDDDFPQGGEPVTLSEEPQKDGTVIVKIKENTTEGYQIRTVKKTKQSMQVRKGVLERQQVFILFFSRFILNFCLSSIGRDS